VSHRRRALWPARRSWGSRPEQSPGSCMEETSASSSSPSPAAGRPGDLRTNEPESITSFSSFRQVAARTVHTARDIRLSSGCLQTKAAGSVRCCPLVVTAGTFVLLHAVLQAGQELLGLGVLVLGVSFPLKLLLQMQSGAHMYGHCVV